MPVTYRLSVKIFVVSNTWTYSLVGGCQIERLRWRGLPRDPTLHHVLPLSGSLLRWRAGGGVTAAAADSPFASAVSPFAYSASDAFLRRRSVPHTRVHLDGSSPPRTPPSVRFSLDRSSSLAAPSLPLSDALRHRTCTCFPTTSTCIMAMELKPFLSLLEFMAMDWSRRK